MFRERVSTQMIPRAERPSTSYSCLRVSMRTARFFTRHQWLDGHNRPMSQTRFGGTSDFGVEGYQTKPPVPKQLRKTHGTRNRKVVEVKEEKNVRRAACGMCRAHVKAILESNK